MPAQLGLARQCNVLSLISHQLTLSLVSLISLISPVWSSQLWQQEVVVEHLSVDPDGMAITVTLCYECEEESCCSFPKTTIVTYVLSISLPLSSISY